MSAIQEVYEQEGDPDIIVIQLRKKKAEMIRVGKSKFTPHTDSNPEILTEDEFAEFMAIVKDKGLPYSAEATPQRRLI